MTDMQITDEVIGFHEREDARDLLHTFLAHGIRTEPLRGEVRAGLYDLLSVLALSEEVDTQQDSNFQAAAWRVAVTKYRALLAEVRANGVIND